MDWVTTNFWEKVEKGESCWIWKGHLNPKGYGILIWSGRIYRAHRLSWELANGEIPRGLMVLHKCDNPPCCNPEHLFLGTALDNHRDMVAKGRRDVSGPLGEEHPMSKLKDHQVKKILEMAKDGLSTRDIANQFSITMRTVQLIVAGKIWRHL